MDGRLRGGRLARKEKATAWAVGLLTGEQASLQACMRVGYRAAKAWERHGLHGHAGKENAGSLWYGLMAGLFGCAPGSLLWACKHGSKLGSLMGLEPIKQI